MKKFINALAVTSFIIFLTGCETTPTVKSDRTPPPNEVAFLDGDNFDNKLVDSLSFDHDEVSIKVYDKFSPNKMPPRIQKWVSHLEKNGVKIQKGGTSQRVWCYRQRSIFDLQFGQCDQRHVAFS